MYMDVVMSGYGAEVYRRDPTEQSEAFMARVIELAHRETQRSGRVAQVTVNLHE
jgi:hypothetical protein